MLLTVYPKRKFSLYTFDFLTISKYFSASRPRGNCNFYCFASVSSARCVFHPKVHIQKMITLRSLCFCDSCKMCSLFYIHNCKMYSFALLTAPRCSFNSTVVSTAFCDFFKMCFQLYI